MPLDKNSSRMIHMLRVTEKKEFKLGRGHESEVRINDISVSRVHALIKYTDDAFLLEDNISKFGTIVLIKDKVHLKTDSTLALQAGRTVISFASRKVEID
jgi:pSer/pThr/pTyr-binding forkhead associated (FHA) protein